MKKITKLDLINENESKQYLNYGKRIRKEWEKVKKYWKNFIN